MKLSRQVPTILVALLALGATCRPPGPPRPPLDPFVQHCVDIGGRLRAVGGVKTCSQMSPGAVVQGNAVLLEIR